MINLFLRYVGYNFRKTFLKTILLYVLVSIFFVLTISLVEPGLITSFIDGFYLNSVVTSSVGFGDITPQTQMGRLVFSIYIYIGNAAYIVFIAQFISLLLDFKSELEKGTLDLSYAKDAHLIIGYSKGVTENIVNAIYKLEEKRPIILVAETDKDPLPNHKKAIFVSVDNIVDTTKYRKNAENSHCMYIVSENDEETFAALSAVHYSIFKQNFYVDERPITAYFKDERYIELSKNIISLHESKTSLIHDNIANLMVKGQE